MSAAPLWTIAEVAKALGLAEKFPEAAIDFVTQDSRLVKPGCLFVALSGTPSGGFVSAFASARDGRLPGFTRRLSCVTKSIGVSGKDPSAPSARATSATVHIGALMQPSTLMRRRPPRDH